MNCFTFSLIFLSFVGIVPGLPSEHQMSSSCISLIAITNNPSLYDPYIREENNRERQLTILKEMYAQGYIETEEAYQAAVDQEMVFRNGTYDEEKYTCASCGFTGTRAEYTETDGEYFCPQCGEPLKPGRRFCTACGAKIS